MLPSAAKHTACVQTMASPMHAFRHDACSPGYMLQNCRRSCGVCSGPVEPCEDQNTSCSYWASNGECSKKWVSGVGAQHEQTELQGGCTAVGGMQLAQCWSCSCLAALIALVSSPPAHRTPSPTTPAAQHTCFRAASSRAAHARRPPLASMTTASAATGPPWASAPRSEGGVEVRGVQVWRAECWPFCPCAWRRP